MTDTILTIAKVIADVPTPAQVKAIAYTVSRYPHLIETATPISLREIREDYRAGYVQGLEAAWEAILVADETGHSLMEIRALLDAEI
jgi:hypothetical protein